MEGFVDSSDTYVNVAIYTSHRHRPSELRNMIARYNSDMHQTPLLQIQIRQQSEFDDEIMTLSGCRNPKNHPFYLLILENVHSPSYFTWSITQDQNTQKKSTDKKHKEKGSNEAETKRQKLKRQLELDLMEAVYIPSGKRQKQRTDTKSPSLVNHQSGNSLQAQNSNQGQIIRLNGPGSDMQASHALTELADLYLSDEESLLQITNQECSPKTQRLERIEKRLDKLDELEVLSSKLLSEHKARDLLAAKVMEQSVEIEDHILKRDLQEAKTAAQTRAANLATESKIKAEQEALEAKQIATEERRLREIAEKEKSMLMFSNIQLSSSLATVSSQDLVRGCQSLHFSLILIIFHS
jgi:hypothetical protein